MLLHHQRGWWIRSTKLGLDKYLHHYHPLLGFFSPPGRPKHPTDRELTYDTSQNPMAGPYWFERAKADHLTEWLDEARKVMIQGG